MQYFGVPRCPYCKKRVNLIRTWSLKRQGEYKCPRCSGISNIYLSPLIYVFALVAVFAGGAIYFFNKFVLNDVSLATVIQVIIPFLLFFAVSLFLVYLQKPVIKKAPLKRRRTAPGAVNTRSASPANDSRYDTGKMFQDDEYVPKNNYSPGPMPRNGQKRQDDVHTAVITRAPAPPPRRNPQHSGTKVMDTQMIREAQQSRPPVRKGPPPSENAQQAVRRPAPRREQSPRPPQGGQNMRQPQSPASSPVPVQTAETNDSREIKQVEIGNDIFSKTNHLEGH